MSCLQILLICLYIFLYMCVCFPIINVNILICMFTIICIRMNIYYVLLSYKPVFVFVGIVAYTIYQKRKTRLRQRHEMPAKSQQVCEKATLAVCWQIRILVWIWYNQQKTRVSCGILKICGSCFVVVRIGYRDSTAFEKLCLFLNTTIYK